ncbi:MAG: cysteine peptidase family C39 domain-containing protein [Actinomycetota bacterium]
MTQPPASPTNARDAPLDLGFTAQISRRRVRVPFIQQMEATECGAACLAMVMAYHGRWERLIDLREACAVTRDGTSALEILHAARRRGLASTAHRRELADLDDVTLPAIAFWGFGHFVVISAVTRSGIDINDPSSGPRRVPWEEVDKFFTGLTLEFVPTTAFQKSGQRPPVARAFAEMMASSWPAILLATFCGALLVVPALVPAFAVQAFINRVIAEQRTDALPAIITALVAAVLLIACLTAVQRSLLLRVQLRTTTLATDRLMRRLLRLPMRFHSARSAGDLAYRLQLGNELAALLVTQVVPALIAAVTSTIFFAAMLLVETRLALIALLAAVVQAMLLVAVQRRQQVRSQQATGEDIIVRVAATQGLDTIVDIKATGEDLALFGRVSSMHSRASATSQRLQLPIVALGALPQLATSLATIAVLIVGARLAFAGQLDAATLVAFTLLLAQFLAPLGVLTALGTTLQTARGALDRVRDVLEQPEDPVFTHTTPKAEAPPNRLRGAVSIRGLTFGYNEDRSLVDRLDLDLAPGARVALVGDSGSGKSTILRLVAGLLEPWAGAIEFDGRDRTEIPRELLARDLASVDQQIVLFAGTVRSNLTLWDESVPDAALERAVEDAALLDTLRSRPGYLDAVVDDHGSNFSGGQRQRLELARALVTDPAVLLLDEATSALDPAIEQVVVSNLMRRGCTILVAAHRLSTVRDADEIIVLHGGRVVERGTHAELVQARGRYLELLGGPKAAAINPRGATS